LSGKRVSGVQNVVTQIRKTDAMSSDDDRQPLYAHWRNSNVSRNFHRLGLLVAAIILMAGLLLMAKDALGVKFWDLIPADIPILAGGIAIGLTGIGLVSLAAYGIVRAIGWSIDKSV
jgi:hypothetical protein